MKKSIVAILISSMLVSISMPVVVFAEDAEILTSKNDSILDNYTFTDDTKVYEVASAASVPEYLFDADYYSIKYSDLRKAFGSNSNALYNHWKTYGIKEGRSPSPVYDPDCYLASNPDLRAAFGNDYKALYNHFVTFGINEFRKSSPIYDGNYYRNHYADLQKAFGNNSKSYINHFLNHGMSEGRQASDNFNVNDYIDRYEDLRAAFGSNIKSYFFHYMEYGISEGRDGSPTGRYSPSEEHYEPVNDSSNSQTAYVKTSGSNLLMRSSASTSASIVTRIPNGSQIMVYGNPTNGFYKVSYNGKTGYASASYITFSKPSSNNNTNSGSGLISNVSRVSILKQASKTCKATAVAQSLNIIVGLNRYTTAGMGGSLCKSINGIVYTGSDGNRYKSTYKQDSYTGSASEQMSKINSAISNGLPIVVAVHSTRGGTQHHWVTIIGKSGSTYKIIDPAGGIVTTMADRGYSFGLADYSTKHYGYVCFTRQ